MSSPGINPGLLFTKRTLCDVREAEKASDSENMSKITRQVYVFKLKIDLQDKLKQQE